MSIGQELGLRGSLHSIEAVFPLLCLTVFFGIGAAVLASNKRPFASRLGFSTASFVVGVIAIWISQAMGRAYWPKTKTLQEKLATQRGVGVS